MPNLPNLDWQPVLLVKVTRDPFTGKPSSLQVSRAHLALHPDGVLYAAWDIPPEQRIYPRTQLVGWKPRRDVPFKLPVQFQRRGDPRVAALIPNGTWVLPYDEAQYQLFQRINRVWDTLIRLIDASPHSPLTLNFIQHLLTTSPEFCLN